jgi:hypothetical protein
MRATLRAMGKIAALALVLSVPVGLSWAEDVKVPQTPADLVKAVAEVGKPGPEHAKLQPLVGRWTYTCRFWMDPNKPPLESKGTVERKWVLGGRFLEEKTVGTCLDGKPGFEGLGLLGYDSGQKKYTSTWACNMGTGLCIGQGDANASGTGFTFRTEAYCPLAKKIVKGRDTIRIEADDKTVAESYQVDDGKETKVMELVFIRKK